MKFAAPLLLLALMSQAATYSVKQTVVDGVATVQLSDSGHHTEVSIAPSIGNIAYEMKVNGKNLFFVPFASIAELRGKPTLCGNPFLAPWANRLDGDAFWANNKKYALDAGLGNLRRDGNGKPIHGLLAFSKEWQVVEAKTDGKAVWVTSRLEFWKHPDLMAQFPFAHTIEMTYRLQDGVLQVETVLKNHALEPMPVAVGFHPYFRLHDTKRDDWTAHLAAREHVKLSPQLIPTGETTPMELADPFALSGGQLDDVFTGLVRDSDGRARFWVQGAKERITVTYGPKYTVAVVYAPPGREFICFEPMSALTNGFNLAHSGLYKELQSVAPGSEWRESYWISASGF